MPPTGEKGRLAVLQLSIFSSMLGVGIIVPFLPVYAQGMGASATVMGLIFSSFSLMRTVTMPYIGMLSDRRGRKLFIVIGLAGYTLLALLLTQADSPWQLVANRCLQGVFAGMVIPVAMALVADISPIGREGTNFGSFNTSLLLGFGLGPFIGGAVYDLWGMDANFYLMAGLSLVSLCLVALLVRDPDIPHASPQASSWSRQLALLKDVGLRSVLAARVGQAMGMGCFIAFLPVLGVNRGLSNFEVGALLGVNVLIMTAVQYPAGRLADRFSRTGLAMGGLVASGVCKTLFPAAGGLAGFMFLAGAEGLAAGLALPALTAITVDHGRRLEAGMGMVMGLYNIAMSVGFILGTVLGGALADYWRLPAAFWLGGVMAAVGSGFLFFPRRAASGAPPAWKRP